MPVLHIFNPETEFALGHGGDYYTPPASVVELRKRLALLPSVYAAPGDYIMLMDDIDGPTDADHQALVESKHLTVLPYDADLSALPADVTIEPWGWNPSLRQWLVGHGVDQERLPTVAWIESLRELAHRRTTVAFLRRCGLPFSLLPREMFNKHMAMEWCRTLGDGYIKAPWSSSGRGVYRCLNPDARDLQQWVFGTIRRQGSVMVEPAWDRLIDYATEWRLTYGKAHFLGFSLFEVDAHCQYTRNVPGAQKDIEEYLTEHSSDDWKPVNVVAKQKEALEAIVAPHYSGLLGVDCLIDFDGNVNPCVEINMRRTMGMIGLELN